jgi:hypothetical protein
MKSTKPIYKTLKVQLDDGSSVQIKRCSLENTDTLLQLQDELLEYYVQCSGFIGEIITKDPVREKLTAMCNILPVVTTGGKEEFLKFEEISDNWEQLITLFFNGSLNDDRELENVTTSSKVSALHFFPYLQMLQKHVAEKEKEDSVKAKE